MSWVQFLPEVRTRGEAHAYHGVVLRLDFAELLRNEGWVADAVVLALLKKKGLWCGAGQTKGGGQVK